MVDAADRFGTRSLSRALNELRKLPPFEYVPPFRGRAIHFRRRQVPFDQLAIDFEALEERKRADFENWSKWSPLPKANVAGKILSFSISAKPPPLPVGSAIDAKDLRLAENG